jgi:hypothetical protein
MACSIGWPIPRSVASDRVAINSARRIGELSPVVVYAPQMIGEVYPVEIVPDAMDTPSERLKRLGTAALLPCSDHRRDLMDTVDRVLRSQPYVLRCHELFNKVTVQTPSERVTWFSVAVDWQRPR